MARNVSRPRPDSRPPLALWLAMAALLAAGAAGEQAPTAVDNSADERKAADAGALGDGVDLHAGHRERDAGPRGRRRERDHRTHEPDAKDDPTGIHARNPRLRPDRQ